MTPQRTTTASSARSRGKRGAGAAANGSGPSGAGELEAPLENPYAQRGERRILGTRVYQPQAKRLVDLAEQLREKGIPKASAAELLQAVLHFGLPANLDEAWDRQQRWGDLLDSGEGENPYLDVGEVNLGHRVYEVLHDRLKQISLDLIAAGYPKRPASEAQVLRATLHEATPDDVDAARELNKRWGMVKRARPSS